MTLTPWVFQSIGSHRCCSLISFAPSAFGLDLIWSLRSGKGVCDEARRPRPDLEFVFSGGGGGRARVFREGGARRLAGADLPGRRGVPRDARRQGRFGRRVGALGARRLSRVAG